jgi:hypothetical protein
MPSAATNATDGILIVRELLRLAHRHHAAIDHGACRIATSAYWQPTFDIAFVSPLTELVQLTTLAFAEGA